MGKFSALRLFAGIYVIIGGLLMVGALLTLLAIAGVITDLDNRIAVLLTGFSGVAVVVGLFMMGLTSIAYGQFIQVVIQIEENTRKQ